MIELNEAFAAQSLAVIKTLGLDPDKVNVNGGAIALGHPLGCTGAKLTASILRELERRNGRYGMVTMCVGGGMGAAGILERITQAVKKIEGEEQMSAVAEQKKIIKGGAFLIEERTPGRDLHAGRLHRRASHDCRHHAAVYRQRSRAAHRRTRKARLETGARTRGKAADLGLIGANIPEEYGGLGLDQTSGALIGENIGRSASFATTLGAESGIGLLPIVYFATEAAKQKYLPKIATGELITAYALTEAGSGSDAMAAKATARLSDDGKEYILNGEKMWITNGGFADIFIVFAKVDGDKFSAFIVERQPGLTSGAEEHKMGIKGSSTTALVLSDVRTPVENLLGEVGKGHKIAFNVLNIGRFKLGAMCVGGMKLMVHESVRYANERSSVWQIDLVVWRDQGEARGAGDSHVGGRVDDLSHARHDRSGRRRG